MTSVINKFEASLTDDARVIIYERHMFMVQATGIVNAQKSILTIQFLAVISRYFTVLELYYQYCVSYRM
jgi:hypothetical protein